MERFAPGLLRMARGVVLGTLNRQGVKPRKLAKLTNPRRRTPYVRKIGCRIIHHSPLLSSSRLGTRRYSTCRRGIALTPARAFEAPGTQPREDRRDQKQQRREPEPAPCRNVAAYPDRVYHLRGS